MMEFCSIPPEATIVQGDAIEALPRRSLAGVVRDSTRRRGGQARDWSGRDRREIREVSRRRGPPPIPHRFDEPVVLLQVLRGRVEGLVRRSSGLPLPARTFLGLELFDALEGSLRSGPDRPATDAAMEGLGQRPGVRTQEGGPPCEGLERDAGRALLPS